MCSGFDFGGMPQVEFIVGDVGDTEQRFVFDPFDYMLFPKMNEDLRRSYCQESLFNLGNIDEDQKGTTYS